MGLWRSITDWTRTIIGCGVLLVITVVVGALAIAALLVFVDPNMLEIVGIKKLESMKSDEEKKAAKRETLFEFLKKVKPSQQFSKSLGRPVKKIVAVSNDAIDALNSELPAELVAQTPAEVDAIALIARSERIVGIYNKRMLFVPFTPPPDGPNAAKRVVMSITVIEPGSGDKIHLSGDLFGPPPPNFLAPGANPPLPESPRALALKYLTSLPRKATGKIILNIEGMIEASDPIDPVLAKTIKLVKVRNRMKDHTVALEADKAYVISMESDAFDTYLRLEDPMGKQVAAHHDGYGMHRARIAYTPTETGEYRIYTASFDGRLGPYQLIVQEAE